MDHPNRIRALRRQRGLTTVELAERADTSNQQIGRLERGERRLTQDWMDRLAEALDCAPWELLPAAPALSEEERQALADLQALDPDTRRSYLDHLRQLARLSRGHGPNA
jgi:transcriptional regulator with XRE-family HTH domain